MPVPRIGISSCLCGNSVRYDGKDKFQQRLVAYLETRAVLVPLCPEVAIGLGIPRPPIQLMDSLTSPQARQIQDREKNVTVELEKYAHTIAGTEQLDGYIFKAKSPSCGLRSTPVFVADVEQEQRVSGIYAQALLDSIEGLPVADESIINQQGKLDTFIDECIKFRSKRPVAPLD